MAGMLSRVVPLRRKLWEEHRAAVAAGRVAQHVPPPAYPLKLIIMSATLRTQVRHGRGRACGAMLAQSVRLFRGGHACMLARRFAHAPRRWQTHTPASLRARVHVSHAPRAVDLLA